MHFPKVDVEGFEHQVLAGANLARFRPWIIVIEATEPLTSKGVWEEWEPILLTSGYEYVHFNGLNRWYLAEERSNLKPSFELPPNVFDGFELTTVESLQAAVESLQVAVESLQHRVATAECDAKRIQASASWRITQPLRVANDSLRGAAHWKLRVLRAAR